MLHFGFLECSSVIKLGESRPQRPPRVYKTAKSTRYLLAPDLNKLAGTMNTEICSNLRLPHFLSSSSLLLLGNCNSPNGQLADR